jgi:hypothetical protein
MKEITTRFTIELAKNGFLVFINDYSGQGTVKPTPYVFETMQNLQEFLKQNFNEQK